MIDILNKEVREKFGSWLKFSKHLGYRYNSSKLFFENNIKRLNEKLNALGLELTVKKKD